MTIPALLHPHPLPSTVLAQFSRLYLLGARITPPIAVVSALSFFHTAYTVYSFHGHPNWKWLAAGAACVVGTIPFTLGVMMPTNKELLMRAENGVSLEGLMERETRALLEKWGRLNLVRGLLGLLGSVLAVSTLL